MSTSSAFSIKVGGEVINLPSYVDYHQAYGQVMYSFGLSQIYTISGDGTVTTSPDEMTVCIIRLTETIEINGQEQPEHFIRVGSTYYPIIKNRTVICKTDRLYMLSYTNGCHQVSQEIIGFSFPSPVSGDAFLGIVLELCEDSELIETQEDDGVSGYMKNGIVAGSSVLAQGLVKAASLTGSAVEYVTPHIMNMVEPSTSQQTEVSPVVSSGFQMAKNFSSSAVHYSGKFASTLGSSMYAVGTYLAPHIQKQGVNLLQSLGLSHERAHNTYSGAINVASGAVEGFSNVYNALEESSKLICASVASNTVKIVEHKYGPEVACVTEDCFTTAGNAYIAAQNFKILTPKGVVKKTFKETGKAVCMNGR